MQKWMYTQGMRVQETQKQYTERHRTTRQKICRSRQIEQNTYNRKQATKTKSTNLRWKHIQYMQQNLLGQGPAKAHVKNQYCL